MLQTWDPVSISFIIESSLEFQNLMTLSEVPPPESRIFSFSIQASDLTAA